MYVVSTLLPNDMYDRVITSITKAIDGKVMHNPQPFSDSNICYKDLSLDRVPALTLRFTGADVEVPPNNMFMEVQKGVSCLTIVPSYQDFGLLGTLFQTNLMVGFDLIKQKVYFKRTDCTIR
ncbi:aspartic proteinase CDR1-like [Bidens hawaiensis]|uniref:aspartic proteinase CDR1-like n=1 Tax=Bidens hawaiensis TaxID=980011 RepID=UPI004049F47B